jgi:hypothetical protein
MELEGCLITSQVGMGRLRWRRALELGGDLIGSGGCLCCDSLERSKISLIGLGR